MNITVNPSVSSAILAQCLIHLEMSLFCLMKCQTNLTFFENICRMLAKESPTVAEKLIYLRCTHHLMIAMGNEDYADSQRQASVALEVSQFFAMIGRDVQIHISSVRCQAIYVLNC